MAVHFAADNQAYTRTFSAGTRSAYSMTCWAKIDQDRNEFSTVWSFGSNSTADAFTLLGTEASGTQLTHISSSTFKATNIVNMVVGTWYYFGLSMNGATGTVVYRTDQQSTFNTVNITGSGAIAHNNFWLGTDPFGGEYLNGSITGVKYYSATLTATELQAEAPYLAPVRTTNLVANYQLVSPSTADDSGNGQTLSGGTGTTTVTGPSGVTVSPVTAPLPFMGWGVPVF
jgi:hypothetical protein